MCCCSLSSVVLLWYVLLRSPVRGATMVCAAAVSRPWCYCGMCCCSLPSVVLLWYVLLQSPVRGVTVVCVAAVRDVTVFQTAGRTRKIGRRLAGWYSPGPVLARRHLQLRRSHWSGCGALHNAGGVLPATRPGRCNRLDSCCPVGSATTGQQGRRGRRPQLPELQWTPAANLTDGAVPHMHRVTGRATRFIDNV